MIFTFNIYNKFLFLSNILGQLLNIIIELRIEISKNIKTKTS